MKPKFHKIGLCLLVSCLIAGCTSGPPPEQAEAPVPEPRHHRTKEFDRHMAAARTYQKQGKWDEAILECAEMIRLDPTDSELQQLYREVREAQLTERAAALRDRAALTERQVRLENKEQESLPTTYGTRKAYEPLPPTERIQETPVEKLLSKPVSMNLEDAELSVILDELSKTSNVQFIADQTLIAGKKITIRMENSPLREILDYLSRNLPVSFYAGENVLWVTATDAAEQKSLQPMETKIYHLRKGVNLPEADQIDSGDSFSTRGAGVTGRGARSTRSMPGGASLPSAGEAAGDTKLEQVIDMFVPKPPGSNILFQRDAHLLIARNTRENLRLLEQIIDALDVTPQQVLIEARFITVGVNDLRELGIEWFLKSDLAVTTRAKGRPETVIESGAGTKFPTPAPTPGGFNLTYTGILTDPLFSAVLHALQTSGKSRTLAVPRVTTVNNRPAKIRIGRDFRYFEQFERQSVLTSVTGVGGTPVYTNELVPVGTPTLEELGIQLLVLPSVGADSEMITLSLAPQNKQFVRFEDFAFGPTIGPGGTVTGGGTIRLPIFDVSEVTTRVVVRSGETVVMGGLVDTTIQREVNKFPILGDLPVLGALFRRNADTEKRSNLLIFVTATLIGYSGESLVPVR